MLKAVLHSYDDARGHPGHRNTLTYSRSLSLEQDRGKLTQRDVLWSVDTDYDESLTTAGSR